MVKDRIVEKSIEVRDLQKKYYSTRDSDVLYKCKKAERELDKLHEWYLSGQTSLFS